MKNKRKHNERVALITVTSIFCIVDYIINVVYCKVLNREITNGNFIPFVIISVIVLVLIIYANVFYKGKR